MKGYPTVDGKAEASGITFAHFIPPSDCSYSSALICNNPLSPDAVHPLEISGVTKINVTQEGLIHFYDPNPDWIVQEVSLHELYHYIYCGYSLYYMLVILLHAFIGLC